MEELLLSDPNYLRDFDTILKSVFNNLNLSKQPKYLIEIGSRDGFALRHSYNFIHAQTLRGKRLTQVPLEVIAIVKDDTKIDIIQRDLSDIPHKVISVAELDVAEILRGLKEYQIDDSMMALYLEFFTENESIDFKNYISFNTHYGLIELQAHSVDMNEFSAYKDEIEEVPIKNVLKMTAGAYIIEASKNGWFPHQSLSFAYPRSRPYTRATLNYFEHRPYKVRQAVLEDFDQILKIEASTVPESFFLVGDMFKKRLEKYPYGQFVLELNNTLIGYGMTEKIASLETLSHVTEKTIETISDPRGSILLLLGLQVVADRQELEGPFLEFVLQRFLLARHITDMVTVVRCSNYPGEDIISMESYVDELIHEGGSADAAVRIYIAHGGEIKKPIAGYRENDQKNLGYGLPILFSRAHRAEHLPLDQETTPDSLIEERTPESIGKTVDQTVKLILTHGGTEKVASYNPSSTFTELGLDSVQLLELRSLLTGEFSVDLPLNFFLLNETPKAVSNYFIETKLRPFKDWLYETKWVSTPKPDPKSLKNDQMWIIFSDPADEIATPLIEFLHIHKQKCIRVQSGEVFEKIDDETFFLRQTSIEDYEKLFNSIPNLGKLEGILYMRGISQAVDELTDPPLCDLEGFHRYSLEGLVFLLRSLAALKLQHAPKLTIVTRSIEQDGSVAGLSEWCLSGLTKICRDEYQKFLCRFISIDPGEGATGASESLFDEIRCETREPQVAFRKGERLVQRLVHSEAETVRIPKFSPTASYMVAGGFRALGILLARWYVWHGAKNIILLDEIEISPQVAAVMEEMKKNGANIVTAKIKLEDEWAISQVFEKIAKELPPLRGLIHAAGIVDNDLIMHMNWDRFKSVHRLKVSLAWNLHRLTQRFHLDHFILFSSCLADVAPLGKANHATGNSFLDMLSHYRRKRALPSLTVNWGPWESKHMEVRRLADTTPSDRLRMLRIEEGLQVLDHLFHFHKPQMVAGIINWLTLFHSIGDANPLFDEIAVELGFKRVDILRKYLEATPEESKKLIYDYIHERVRIMLYLKSSQQLESGIPLSKMGMEASKASTLKNYIQFDLEEAVKLPINFVQPDSTLNQLSEALSKALEEAIYAKPVSVIKTPIATIGVENNKVIMDVLNVKLANISKEALSESALNSLKMKLDENVKATIITVEPI